MSLDELMRQRREKLAQWRALGIEPYAYRFEPTHHAADLLALGAAVTEAPGETVRVAGRLMAIRGHGKAGFAHLLDGSGRIQLYFRADHLGESFRRYELLDVGDWVGVAGSLFRTRTGEITVRVDAVELLAKALRPLPEKWHGLKDPETRFRQRYADLFMNLEVRETFRRRARLTSAMREFLDARGFLEVETPVLQPLYGGAFARPFVTRHHALDMDLYLRISNELYLKRLIVGGLERVYEFSRDFRNEGMDRSHNPEFTMLEFYQAFADVHEMMDVTEALIAGAVERACGTRQATYQGQILDWTPPWPRISMLDAVSDAVGESVRDLDRARLERVAASRGMAARPGTGAGGLLDELFSVLVQPGLVRPCFVVDYPVELSPLARVKRGHPAVVERFEVFAAGMELSNAFSEQNDPEAQARAFEDQGRRREAGDEEAQQMDHDYVRALEYGMPPTGGVGIGIDRLTMLVCDARSIRDVILFPQLRPEEGRAEIDHEADEETAGRAGRGSAT
ncbi:MAG: lysine--tRNA ligase [Candidatus Eisenbacteria bacterium]|uniref:Lysine--tRNA ligase n=1 Tax=Eiseniibacteriota bacterium TaxID=2212470 RepID=A0A9D6QIS3_UNCEI|nr:lysine--tRNA ligase [Candidatus Eisenbacteria bacterium]MBI3539737.1 lysine--tRNA ligase [Candidatus Eisenbacteria bacterium]